MLILRSRLQPSFEPVAVSDDELRPAVYGWWLEHPDPATLAEGGPRPLDSNLFALRKSNAGTVLHALAMPGGLPMPLKVAGNAD
jgi:hypothetical protein